MHSRAQPNLAQQCLGAGAVDFVQQAQARSPRFAGGENVRVAAVCRAAVERGHGRRSSAGSDGIRGTSAAPGAAHRIARGNQRAICGQLSTKARHRSWMTMNCTTSKCRLTGLTPGTLYFFRVGAVGTRDQILFSYVVSKMAA